MEVPRSVFQANGVDPDTILPGRGEMDFFVKDGGDIGCFYDAQYQKIASPSYHTGIPANFLCYCPEYGVLVSVHVGGGANPSELRVWSLEVEPTILTNPTPFIGTPMAGQVVTYRVRLTGAQTDPAEGELVDWTLTGVGLLLDMQSKTDAQGYAIARVQYRLGETGNSTLNASVTC